MKKVTIFAALCGIIFAGITTTCYARPNWERFLPRPIVIPVDSSSLSSDITIAAIDFRKYLPRPIVIPVDSAGFSSPIELTSSYQGEIIIAKRNTVLPPSAPGPIDPKTTTRYQNEPVISAAPVAKDPPPHPWIRKTLTA
ncbi:MAG: hypothetical protein A2509_12140 [Candidatus Edwardsbacteria bacterium RIFOXYD12_FULL_50_11]|uniref:Uncharacterized protein n=1 Tax=Candidatus Edwardsbacteria bacterium GWF2_54_11 TaxID=1817851 RepID=A0A1F5R5M2_9BACT|nr:MAG: hypothetical protein A2502_03925 [Candidatus Edwardsbacteria bacterium RifOxyC12_full_54_24]OGF08549.1 MAG: hypothetical protein A2273_06305 [Candidatus Edwardsbacteria bacterium RifOxyA12_full_54_48]OGF09221.1 MAG: hypothetical protein A2024_04535 [Candidatus Edwardsbacteria bacterium GWF2_54_11]OGF11387.1 MAG: hypothetical protein A3K15_03450 [Candidatus Edwardsbacteria bacterium GWE2_54_12]OGF16865.1 MAG: hypothetical protein A2509_12140 [Candidatus Edwardsbacteria bacterium RIFOXYD1